MKSTEYLTGYKASRYPELEPLATKRIDDMKELLTELRGAARQVEINSKEYKDIEIRYKKVEKAIKFWRTLLHEGELDAEDVK